MKSVHRHELKTNELAEWIANLPKWARENGRMVIYISVVAVLVVGSGLWYWRKITAETVQQQLDFTSLVARLSQNKIQILMNQQSGNDTSYSLIVAAEELGTFAGGAEDKNMAALALIKQADALRAGLHYRQQIVDQTDLQRAINEVKSVYNKALEKVADSPSLTAMARFGLGLCEEEVGNFGGAQRIYSDIVANSDFEGTTVAAEAKQRLETMADYEQRIVFKAMPGPKQPPADFMQQPADLLQPPIPLRPIEDNITIEGPNRMIIAPDVNIGPEPNHVPESLDIKIQPPAPNTDLEIADINVPGE